MVQHSSQCPACGTALSPGGSGEGLCPGCLLDLALEASSLPGPVDDPEEPATLAAAQGPFAPGSVLGNRYRIRSLLGRGGMGEVWRAFDLKLRVDVALKALRTRLLGEAEALEILRQEVRSAREVVSPNVCRVFDLEELDGAELVSMEYVDGTTLRQVLDERSPLDLEEAQEIASQFLAGLEAIHAAGLVHRDIKPDNVMITQTGRVVVMDFGVAKALTGAWEGSISGTPAYMSPEHLRGEPLDPRSDVYAAGFVLAEMVDPDGVRTSDSRKRVLDALRATPPAVADTPWAPLLQRAVAADRELRQETAAVLARALDEITVRAAGDEDLEPYPGLASFTSADAEYFFGRELEIEKMWRKLQRPHLLALIGPSGSGKSSFLRAGLLPATPPGWRVLLAKPGNRPMLALAKALVGELSGDGSIAEDFLRFDEPDVAVGLFARWRREHKQALLIVDQFEELFTQNADEVQDEFAGLLRRLSLEADVRVLLTLRDDFLYRCASHEALAPVLSELTLLKTLSGAGLRRALVQPALKCGYRFEDDRLVDEMVAEVSAERGALPLLAFAAAKLWELRDRERGMLVRAAYEDIGGVAGALAQHAEETLEAIGPERLPLVRELFRNLVTPDGTRAARQRGELLSLFEGEERKAADEILSELIDARLLTSYDETDREDDEAAASRVEIIHESLLSAWPRLVRWQTQDADSAQMREQVRRAAAVWDERGRSEDLLWTGNAYREFAVWRDAYPGRLTGLEKAFAEAMVELAGRTRRRRRLAIAAAFALLVGGLAVVASFWQRATVEARRAEASKLVGLGHIALEEDPAESLAYALASLELSDQEAARLLALETLWSSPTAWRMADEEPRFAAFAPDGAWLALGYGNGLIELLPRDGGPAVAIAGHEGEITHLEFAGADLLASCGASDRKVKLWSLPGLEPVRTLPVEANQCFRVARGDNGSPSLVTWEGGGSVKRWSVDGEAIELGSQSNRWTGAPYHWDVDPTGSFFVYGDGESILRRPLREFAAREPEVIGTAHARVRALAVSQDGRMIATAFDQPPGVRLWALTPPFGELPLQSVPTSIMNVAFSPDSSRLAAASRGPQAYLWDLEGPPDSEPQILRRRGGIASRGVVFSPDSGWLAAIKSNGTSLWHLGRKRGAVLRKAGAVWGMVSAPDLSWVAASGPQQTRIWPGRRAGGAGGRDLVPPDEIALRMAATPDGSMIAVVWNTRGEVSLLAPDGSSTRDFRAFPRPSTTVTVGPRGRLLASGGGFSNPEDAFVRLWDLETEEIRDLRPGHGRWITFLAITEDDRLLESSENGLLVWDLASGEHRELWRGPVWDGQPGPDGKSVVFLERTEHFQGIPRRLDLDSAEELPIADWDSVGGLTVTPEGEMVGGTPEGVIQIGRLGGGRPHLLFGHEGAIMNTAAGAGWILSGGAEDGTVRIWPRPDTSETPFHLLPYEELLDRLRGLTNVRVVPDSEALTGYRTEVGAFPGWEAVPEW